MRKTPCYNEFAICIKIGSAIDIDNQKYTIVINPFHLTSHLRTQTYILPYWSNVSKPAQNASFEYLESIDNQYSFDSYFASSSTGKERDEETGYGYFGARYIDHELMTMWLSVDPMADKYPNISPYAYCAWNPVKLVDPDEEEIGDFFDKKGNYLGTDNKNDARIYILKDGQTINDKDDFTKKATLDKFTEVSSNSDLYALISAVYAEMGGSDRDSKQIVAESIYNRANLPDNTYEKADGTYKGVIKRAYDVANPRNKRYDHYKNPQNHVYANPSEYQAWIESTSVAIMADKGMCNMGNGVIFYNSASSTIYDNNKRMEKIPLTRKMSGIKGMWKLRNGE